MSLVFMKEEGGVSRNGLNLCFFDRANGWWNFFLQIPMWPHPKYTHFRLGLFWGRRKKVWFGRVNLEGEMNPSDILITTQGASWERNGEKVMINCWDRKK
jgi:hypothetical protein